MFSFFFNFLKVYPAAQATRLALVQRFLCPLAMLLQGRLYTTDSQLSPLLAQQGNPQNGRARGAVDSPHFFPQGSVRRIGLV